MFPKSSFKSSLKIPFVQYRGNQCDIHPSGPNLIHSWNCTSTEFAARRVTNSNAIIHAAAEPPPDFWSSLRCSLRSSPAAVCLILQTIKHNSNLRRTLSNTFPLFLQHVSFVLWYFGHADSWFTRSCFGVFPRSPRERAEGTTAAAAPWGPGITPAPFPGNPLPPPASSGHFLFGVPICLSVCPSVPGKGWALPARRASLTRRRRPKLHGAAHLFLSAPPTFEKWHRRTS